MDSVTDAQRFYLVNAFPAREPPHLFESSGIFIAGFIVQYLPKWFPGAQFITTIKIGRELSRQMFSKPFAMAKELIVRIVITFRSSA